MLAQSILCLPVKIQHSRTNNNNKATGSASKTLDTDHKY
jgi:hypothetical protein